MIHDSLLINLKEWLSEDEKRTPRIALFEIIKYLVGRGYKSLEIEFSNLLKEFTSFDATQNLFPEVNPKSHQSLAEATLGSSSNYVYISYLKKAARSYSSTPRELKMISKLKLKKITSPHFI